MKNLLIFLPLLFLITSCSKTPEERAEKVVKDYCSAIQKHDYTKAASLFYDYDAVEEVSVVVDEPEPLVSNLDVPVEAHRVIGDKSEIKIVGVKTIFSKSPTITETSSVEEAVEAEVADSTIVENVSKGPATKETSSALWPSNCDAAYLIEVESGSFKIIFTVVQLGEKEFKIYSTKGLYIYDFSEVIRKIGCTPVLPQDVNDEVMDKNVSRFIQDLKAFDILSTAVEANDSAKIVRVFSGIANREYTFNEKPTPKTYDHEGEYTIITTNDSLKFAFNSSGEIIDCYGVINLDDIKAQIRTFGDTPYTQGEKFDIEYSDVLWRQLNSLEREKERKAKAAKYKTQGVALISSEFSKGEEGAKGVNFSALNTSSKTAKYIIMEVVGYNSVDDPVWSNGYLKTCRGIGPIEPGEGGTWDFDEIWKRGDLVKSYEIKKLTIQFTDGTSKSVKLPQELPSDWRTWLY